MAPAGAAAAAGGGRARRATSPHFLALLAKGGPCDDFVEPEGIDPAFGAARHYRLCGEQIRVLHAAAPTWLLRSSEGAVAARVGYGRGDITANALDGSFDNRALVRDDGALAFAAMLQLRDGDTVWFFDEETRARLLSLLWDHGAAAFLLAGAAILLLLWRSGARFGPLLADAATVPPLGRRAGTPHGRLHRCRRRRGVASGERSCARGGSAPLDRRLRDPPRRA